MLLKRRVIVAWATSLAAMAAQAQSPAAPAPAAVSPIPVADFFNVSAMDQPVMSPDGQHLAVRVGGKDGRMKLAVLSLQPPRQIKQVAGFDDGDVVNVQWVNNQRLVLGAYDRLASWDQVRSTGLWAVDRDGGNFRQLIHRGRGTGGAGSSGQSLVGLGMRTLDWRHDLDTVLRDGSADVIVVRGSWNERLNMVDQLVPLRLDTLTGLARTLEVPSPAANVSGWMFDRQGQPRVVISREASDFSYWYRKPGQDAWAQIERVSIVKSFGEASKSVTPYQLGPGGDLYVTYDGRAPEGTTALYRLDPVTHKPEKDPIVNLKAFDFTGQLVFDQSSRKLVGVHFETDAYGTEWLDPARKAVQDAIDKRLPGLVNVVGFAGAWPSKWAVVSSFSDRDPGRFYLYDVDNAKLELLGQSRPQIDPRRMADRGFERIPTRDKLLSMPVHITQPAGKGPFPTVVLVHGGPWVPADSWSFDAEAQFLASRGYPVLQPEFRGTARLGDKHLKASQKQWGLTMQDDVADAARWAIAKGLADPKRICIAGASYGGYATLMGLVRDHDLYRCGVSWVGVTDLELLKSATWSDMSNLYRDVGFDAMVGNPQADAAQFEATTPVKQAARIKRPLMLVYGAVDRRVPIEHGTRMREALIKAGNPPEWVVYNDEGHGFLKMENRVDFYKRVEAFLDKHLKNAP